MADYVSARLGVLSPNPRLVSLLNNRIEAWKAQALLRIFVDKTHSMFAKTSNGTNPVGSGS
jgi:hypothetical protein